MSFVKRATLLLLLAAIGTNAAPEDCDGLNKTLPTADLHKVFGDWVLVWSVVDQNSYNLLANLSGSHIKLRLLPDNKTIEFNERIMLQDQSCSRYVLNMSMPSEPSDNNALSFGSGMYEGNGEVSQLNDSGEMYFFESCSDCLVMTYRGILGHYLLIYKRHGHHQDVEQLKAAHSDHQKLAECLGFPVDKPFSYDGAAVKYKHVLLWPLSLGDDVICSDRPRDTEEAERDICPEKSASAETSELS